ncbi:Heme-based aerotactic transducer HemAT [Hartmannibacter diazotrophicus]|uniref:Heme-based aerotactic transducer HemAT n=1 Tax=Hartmannibacter diazotrophicus TaxID=1482074 RepID=A0A2C9D4S0_9HYPH|nr:globin-coupled sensor protein [Hartmannibacter diazotrophicus]SON54495.1 Heme-based aerotactic transducer HemAT [Hartmannibacter diazotrophicus]
MTGLNADRQERLRFARIGEDDRLAMREAWAIVEPKLDETLVGFYAHVTTAPSLAALVGNRTKDLSSAQKKHWAKLFSGKFDDEYFDSATKIGHVHCRIGLEPRWYIGGYQFLIEQIMAVLSRSTKFSRTRFLRLQSAFSKAILLDLDIAISTYQEAELAARQAREDSINAAIEKFRSGTEGLVTEVERTAEGMRAEAGSLDATATGAGETAEVAFSASQSTRESVQGLAAASEELAASITEISERLSTTVAEIYRAGDKAEASTQSISRLSESGKQIGDVVSLIQDIAEQTNLLALNATIESARAGEAGKGFAVVAQEVKALAGQTAKATDDISRQIAGIQNETQSAVDAVGEISQIMSEVRQFTAAIAAAIEQQQAVTQEIAGNVHRAASGTDELSRTVEAVRGAIQSTKSTADGFAEVSEGLSSQAVTLAGEIRTFIDNLKTGASRAA